MTKLRDKALNIGKHAVIGTAIAAGVAGGAISVREWVNPGGYSVATVMKPLQKSTPFDFPVNVYCSGSGGNVTDDFCIVQNPLKNMSGATAGNAGTGVIIDGWLELGNNPTGASYDVCFVSAPQTATGSHRCVIDNSCSSTGCVTRFDTGSTILFNGDLYLKAATITAQSGSGTARLRFLMHDVFGE